MLPFLELGHCQVCLGASSLGLHDVSFCLESTIVQVIDGIVFLEVDGLGDIIV